MRRSVDPDEVILEFVRIGAVVRVSAMHPPSLTEVVVQGPVTAGPEALERLALDKLAWRLRSGTDGKRETNVRAKATP
jgi:hypothetical protein